MGGDKSVKESKLPDENPVPHCRPVKKNEGTQTGKVFWKL